jgi:DNA-binding LytR/AlgR family response regulator
MKLKCMVVDDEPLAQEVLVIYIKDCPSLELVKLCSDALEAGEFLASHQVDLIFLDINMPRLSGIRFVKTLVHPVLIIFTTAYPEFAAEGFETSAVDFLVKPFSFERFMTAVSKAMVWTEFRKKKEHPMEIGPAGNQEFILLRSDKKIFKIQFEDIRYFESTGDYIKVHTGDRQLVIHGTFKNLVKQLPQNLFIRVHKSYIVSISKIRMIEGNQIEVAGQKLPIGLVFKEDLIKRLKTKYKPNF